MHFIEVKTWILDFNNTFEVLNNYARAKVLLTSTISYDYMTTTSFTLKWLVFDVETCRNINTVANIFFNLIMLQCATGIFN